MYGLSLVFPFLNSCLGLVKAYIYYLDIKKHLIIIILGSLLSKRNYSGFPIVNRKTSIRELKVIVNMVPNTLLFTFANDKDAYLNNLEFESKAVGKALSVLEDRGQVHLHRELNVNVEEAIDLLDRFDGRLLIFHFAGHASGAGISLHNSFGHASGLANLLGQQDTLQLVFLNGCSTAAQVQDLLDLGVPTVIATQAKINDRMASWFASKFYEKLANGGSIKQSFEFAKAALVFKEGKQLPRFKIRSVRKSELRQEIALKGAPSQQTIESPWTLYYKEDVAEALNWTLPKNRFTPESDLSYEPNEFIAHVLDEMAKFSPSLARRKSTLNDEREYLDLIIKSFPWNIGSQISILVSTDDSMSHPSVERLEQIISTYLSCTQFLYYLALSEFWDQYPRIGSLPTEGKNKKSQGVPISKSNILTFDYLHQFVQILQKDAFDTKRLFLKELVDICGEMQKDNHFYHAYLYLESIRGQIQAVSGRSFDKNLVTACAEAEYALFLILSKMAFLSKYMMIAVRDIYFHNPRHRPASYQHHIGKVSAHSSDRVVMFRDLKDLSLSLWSSSIILVKDLDKPEEKLNLTPFYMDKNAYLNRKATATDLYTFAFKAVDEASVEQYYYIKSGPNFFRSIADKINQLHTGDEILEGGRRHGSSRLNGLMPQKKVRPFRHLKEQFDHFK